ncbi:MAG: XRE family transcriptional regulator [Bryobacterales bacterium]|nr:XRE family transcriptional regulator [Bryobacterales bacterium]MDE0261108.1 XRE family transcriptional regulator [Bryobacterales bacterium]
MADKTVPITAQVLAWTREEAGLTQGELAERANVAVAWIRAWEAAESRPTRGQFSKLVGVLKRPSALFFLPKPPVEAGMPTTLRSAPALGNRTLGSVEARQIRRARRLQEVTSWVLRDEGSPEVRLRQYRPSQDPVEIGVVERSQSGISASEQFAWASASEAFRSWRVHLENQGILVMQLTMGKNNIRGFGAWDDYAPLVAVNTAYHPTARIFTLFHEVAHLLTRTDAACQSFVIPGQQDGPVERWCERFAAAFLLPEGSLKTVAGSYGVTVASPTDCPDTARLIANRFSVSTRATAIRLQEVGLAEPSLYPAVAAHLAAIDWNDSSGGGGGGQPAFEKRVTQFGERLPSTLFAAADRGRLTTRDLADYLQLKTGQLDDLKGLLDEP